MPAAFLAVDYITTRYSTLPPWRGMDTNASVACCCCLEYRQGGHYNTIQKRLYMQLVMAPLPRGKSATLFYAAQILYCRYYVSGAC